jgi:FKBP-type peptidyl-prolyl cis-trans isomerase
MGKVVPVEPVVIKGAALTSPFGRDKVAAKVKAAEEAAAAARAAETAAREQALAGVIQKVESETGKKVEKSGSGLMWVVLKEGSGASPQPTDTVEVHYTGWLVNGKEFDSSAKHGGPATFPLNRVIKGWTEGVGLMKVGEKRKFIIPSELAYGKRGSPPDIGPDATLIFDVELLGIK